MKNKSFALIELLVVISIIVILTGIVFAGYRTGQQQLALQRAANQLAQDIRRAQGLALAAENFHGAVPSGGYGIYFSGTGITSYILFADCDNDKTYDTANTCPDCSVAPCNSNQFPEQLETIELEKDVSISALSSSPLQIAFTPPDPTVTITLSAPGQITLSLSGQTKTITVNKAGLIEID
jgi:Tfp pilus assembly protein FimT